jgi:nitrate reductase NapE component
MSPTAGIKSKGHAERAIVFFFSVVALTIYPARAVGCLSGKYGVVCSFPS